MTTEEKAKAYDEVLAKAKDFLMVNKGNMVGQQFYELMRNHFFPELKESDDERIMEWLIHDIRQALEDNVYNSEGEKDAKIALAWLEKQKMQKPAEWSKEDERLRQSCINHIESELEQVRNDKYGHSEIISDLKESCRERINWLESLRPQNHWEAK